MFAALEQGFEPLPGATRGQVRQFLARRVNDPQEADQQETRTVDHLMARIGAGSRGEPRRRARDLLLRLMSDLPVENWTIAEHAGNATRPRSRTRAAILAGVVGKPSGHPVTIKLPIHASKAISHESYLSRSRR